MFFPKISLAKNPLRFGNCLNLASKMNWCLNGDKRRALGPELSQGEVHIAGNQRNLDSEAGK